MLFHSFSFVLAFFPAVAIVHTILAKQAGPRLAQVWLLASSIFFYGFAKPSNLPLLFGSIVFNWAAARAMAAVAEGGRRKALLRAALAANILFLCCFKYARFLLGSLPLGSHFALPDWSFPLGISFFTLTQVMFLVDTYQGLNGPNSLFDHAALVSFFPYVISGPLVRSRAIVPQFRGGKMSGGNMQTACFGLYLFAIGLAKKVVFADSFAAVADAGYRSPASLSTMEAWVATLAYAFQIYFDFSGYSDMAVGAARMVGIEIPQNFNVPYRSKSISEFWQRWHISLSQFITNYLYTPLLRSIGTATIWTSALATLLAMGIAGLWHGPSWTFVLWGLFHGAGLSVNQIWKRKKFGKLPDWLGWLLTFVFVNLAYVLFRSPHVSAAILMFGRMVPHGRILGFAELRTALPLNPLRVVLPAAAGIALAFGLKGSVELEKGFRPVPLTALAAAALLLVDFFFMNSVEAKQFLYFVF
jgi:D-alanyl-lipoteichoic acid acyltransferase DltB (MBOAT superfamily)